jgi:transposase
VAGGGDYYLCPLPQTQVSAAELQELITPVRAGKLKPEASKRMNEESGRLEKIAEGYEYPVTIAAELDGEPITCTERRLVVHSFKMAEAQSQHLDRRLTQAVNGIKRLNERKKGKPRLKNQAEVETAVAAILKPHRVGELGQVQYHMRRQEQPVHAYGDRPARVQITEEPTVRVRINRPAVAEAKFALGWRVYATNAPRAQLSLTKAVLAYRGSYLIERGFPRLKGPPLSLTPIYLTTPGRLTGLVRVLLIGLRVLGLIEYKARRELAKRGEKIAGLTKGLPKKATAHPTTEALLPAFDGITLTRIGQQGYLTPLSELQRRILELIGFTAEI